MTVIGAEPDGWNINDGVGSTHLDNLAEAVVRLGADIGISTTRLHSYGPMGLEALTVERFVVRGEGQVRH